MGFNPNIKNLLNEAFGLDTILDGTGNFKGVTVVDNDIDIHRVTYLGTPIIFPVILKGQNYRIYKDNGEVGTISVRDFELPAVTLSTFSRKKNLSKTELTAGYGSVTEMYGFSDWRIEIRGLCIKEKSHPHAKTVEAQLKRLYQFEKIAQQIPVVSSLYNNAGIQAIEIEELYINQLEGRPDVIPFRMNCKSAAPKELIL